MAWDSTAPTVEELSTSKWDATPPTKEELSIPWSDVPGNAMKDIGNMAKSGMTAAKNVVDPENIVESSLSGSFEPTKQKLSQDFESLKAIPGSLLNEVKQTVTHPIETFKEHPVNTALNVGAVAAPFLGEMGKGAEVAKAAAPEAVEATRVPPVAEVPKVAPEPPPAAPRAPEPVAPPVPPAPAGIPFQNQLNEAVSKAGEVKDYISRGYEGFAKKPGAISNVADYVQSKSQMMSLQQMGFTPGQIRNLGKTATDVHNAERAIGQYGLDSGIVDATKGLEGMVETNAKLLKSTGDTIAKFRQAADSAGPAYQPGELETLVRQKLDPIYRRGVTAESPAPRGTKGPDSSSYLRALEEVADADPTHHGAADVATRLNGDATQATKMSQNPGPYTDVANAISEINNERIKGKIGPQSSPLYENALREFGVNKKIQNALKYKSAGEVKRFGPGSIGSNMIQKGMDEFGYKVGAKAANKLSTSILKNPAIAKNLPSLFKEFINHVEDIGHEVSGMSQGGIVPEMKEFVNSRGCR